MEIRLSKCTLRPWRLEDAASLAQFANNPKIAENLRDGFPHPYRLESAYTWLNMALSETRNVLLAIELDGLAAGGIGVAPKPDVYRISAEIGYWLAEEYWNRGIMTEAVAAMVNVGFTLPEIRRITAGIYEPNRASMRVLEKCGFRLEAVLKGNIIKNGRILDEYIYSIVKP